MTPRYATAASLTIARIVSRSLSRHGRIVLTGLLRGRWRFLQPARLANRDRDVSHGRGLARPVPVLLAGTSRHRIALIDALGSVSAGQDPPPTLCALQHPADCLPD